MTQAMTKSDLDIISARERAAFRDEGARLVSSRTSERIDHLANLRSRSASVGAEIRGLLKTQRERLMEYKQMLFNLCVVGKANVPLDADQLGERLEKHQKKIDTLEKHLRVVDFVGECLIMGMRAEYLKLKQQEGDAKARAAATVSLQKLHPTIKAFNTQIRDMMTQFGARKKPGVSGEVLSAADLVGIGEEELLVLGVDDLVSRYQVNLDKEKTRYRSDQKPLLSEGRRMEKESIRHIYAAGSEGGPPPLPKPVVSGATATVSRGLRQAAPRYQQAVREVPQPQTQPQASRPAPAQLGQPQARARTRPAQTTPVASDTRKDGDLREQFGSVFDEMIEEFTSRRRR